MANWDPILEELTAALDFPDEVAQPDAAAVACRLRRLEDALASLSRSWERGRLVREGAAVAIVGPPNAGKSSLLNGLLGTPRALVSGVAGTTRDTLEENVALGEGLVARLIDTAGLHDAGDALEAAAIGRTHAALAEARLAVIVLDASRPLDVTSSALLRETRQRERVVYFNKRDLGTVAYDEREPSEHDALLGCAARARRRVEAVRTALAGRLQSDVVDVARPHLGTARQADAVLQARRALTLALETLDAGAPIDLLAPDLAEASAALGALSGRDASEAVVDGIFARFCIGK